MCSAYKSARTVLALIGFHQSLFVWRICLFVWFLRVRSSTNVKTHFQSSRTSLRVSQIGIRGASGKYGLAQLPASATSAMAARGAVLGDRRRRSGHAGGSGSCHGPLRTARCLGRRFGRLGFFLHQRGFMSREVFASMGVFWDFSDSCNCSLI